MSRLQLGLSGLALAILLGTASVVAAEETNGTVRSVSTDRSIIILRGLVSDTTYDINKDAKVCLDGKKGKLADVRPGDTVHLTYAKDGKLMKVSDVRSLSTAKEDTGTLRSVDAQGNKLILKGLLRDSTYHMMKDAKIWINGKESQLADLRAGDSVLVTYNEKGDQFHGISIMLNRK
jgi:hypothetical protein